MLPKGDGGKKRDDPEARARDLKLGDLGCIPESSQTSFGALLSSSFSCLPNIASNILVAHRDVSRSPSTHRSARTLSRCSHLQKQLQDTQRKHTAPGGLVMQSTKPRDAALGAQERNPGLHSHVKHPCSSSRTRCLYSVAPAQRNSKQLIHGSLHCCPLHRWPCAWRRITGETRV